MRLLLGADAFPIVIRESLERWRSDPHVDADAPNRVRLDAFKLPHHGSKKNVTPELMAVVDSPAYLFSSSGKRFRHPDTEAVRIVLEGHTRRTPPVLCFNYRSQQTELWDGEPGVVSRYESDAVSNGTPPDGPRRGRTLGRGA